MATSNELTRRDVLKALAALSVAAYVRELPVSDPARLAKIEAGLKPLSDLIVTLIEFQATVLEMARQPQIETDAEALLQAHLKAMDVPQKLEELLTSLKFGEEVLYVTVGEVDYKQACFVAFGER